MRAYEGADATWGSRAIALQQELLIDLREWAEENEMRYPFSCSAAITRECWESIGAVPYHLVGKVTEQQRVARVVHRAVCALDRYLKDERHPVQGSSFRVEFGVPLPTSGTAGGDWTTMQLESGRGDHGEAVLTIGLVHRRRREPNLVC